MPWTRRYTYIQEVIGVDEERKSHTIFTVFLLTNDLAASTAKEDLFKKVMLNVMPERIF